MVLKPSDPWRVQLHQHGNRYQRPLSTWSGRARVRWQAALCRGGHQWQVRERNTFLLHAQSTFFWVRTRKQIVVGLALLYDELLNTSRALYNSSELFFADISLPSTAQSNLVGGRPTESWEDTLQAQLRVRRSQPLRWPWPLHCIWLSSRCVLNGASRTANRENKKFILGNFPMLCVNTIDKGWERADGQKPFKKLQLHPEAQMHAECFSSPLSWQRFKILFAKYSSPPCKKDKGAFCVCPQTGACRCSCIRTYSLLSWRQHWPRKMFSQTISKSNLWLWWERGPLVWRQLHGWGLQGWRMSPYWRRQTDLEGGYIG